MTRRLTKEEFVEKAVSIHGNRYDYSLVEYQTARKHVKIICPEHGPFLQTPDGHLSGKNCRKCGMKGTVKRHTSTTEKFIGKAREVHGDRYDYSRVRYERNHIKVEIICPVHGVFLQAPAGHLAGKGCRGCNSTGPAHRTTDQFIEAARSVHGDKYEYGRASYKTARDKVWITCDKHGDFLQTPLDHVAGCGCPKCPYRSAEPHYLYVMRGPERVKIGVSINPARRAKNIGASSPFEFQDYGSVLCRDRPSAHAAEVAIHKLISHLNCGYTGFDGATEWFNIPPQDALSLAEKITGQMGVAV